MSGLGGGRIGRFCERITGVQTNTLRIVTAVRASRSRDYVSVTPALSPEFA